MEFRNWRLAPSHVKLRYLDTYAIGPRILDVGCGQGFYSEYLSQKGFDVTAIDMDPPSKPESKVRWLRGDATHIPVESSSFDTVLAFDIIEHIADEARVFEELLRVTKRRLILSVPNGNDEKLVRHNLTFKHFKDRTHFRTYTQHRLQEILKQLGFHIISLHPEGPVSETVFLELLAPGVIRIIIGQSWHFMKRVKLVKIEELCADIYGVADKV